MYFNTMELTNFLEKNQRLQLQIQVVILILYVPSIPEWDAKCTTTLITSNPFRNYSSILRDTLRESPKEFVAKNYNQKGYV
jgi:hypothetical protein